MNNFRHVTVVDSVEQLLKYVVGLALAEATLWLGGPKVGQFTALEELHDNDELLFLR